MSDMNVYHRKTDGSSPEILMSVVVTPPITCNVKEYITSLFGKKTNNVYLLVFKSRLGSHFVPFRSLLFLLTSIIF